MRSVLLFALLSALVVLSVAQTPEPALPPVTLDAQVPRRTDQPQNIILFVPDGAGPSAFTLARRVLDRPLALDAHLGGTVSTASASHEITDSAASATAYACGLRTVNLTVGVDADGRACRSLLTIAKARGMATGLVTTAPIVDATPAAFGAHSRNRYAGSVVADQLLGQGIDVLLGGGRDAFLPAPDGTRTDGRDLLDEARARGYTTVRTPAALSVASVPLLGLFAPGVMEYEIDRDPAQEPGLADMTTTALSLLSTDPDGFFLLVETEGTDEAGHSNDPVAMVHEIESVDAVFQVLLDFAEADTETLVVVVADHETGGLTLARRETYYWGPEWLRAPTRSAHAMQRRVLEGGDPVEVFRTTTGSDSVSAEERARLEAAPRERIGRTFSAVLSDRAGVAWSTTGHTAVDVNLYRYGPGSDRLTGHLRNDELGRLLLDFLGAEPLTYGDVLPVPPRG